MVRSVGWLSALVLSCSLIAGQAQAGKFMSQAWAPSGDGPRNGIVHPYTANGLVGPYGQPIVPIAPDREPTGADYAYAMLAKQYGQGTLQQAGVRGPIYPGLQLTNHRSAGPMPVPPGGPMPPMMPPMGPPMLGMPSNPHMAQMPGHMQHSGPPGAVAAIGTVGAQPSPFGVHRTEIRFVGPASMKISWYAPRGDGRPGFTPQYLEAPARYNFLQASIYRLKLSDIPNRPGLELYPTLEIVPSTMKTATFLAHSAVPVSFTDEDLDQVTAGNFVIKVIYLPDPQFQDLAATGPDEVVSSRLEPGVDPIVEAKRRGTILAIVRLGNIDLEAPNTPAMDAPDPHTAAAMGHHHHPPMMPPQMPPVGGSGFGSGGASTPPLPLVPPLVPAVPGTNGRPPSQTLPPASETEPAGPSLTPPPGGPNITRRTNTPASPIQRVSYSPTQR